MKYLKSLNEWRQQLEIPFDGKGKPSHINVLDGLKDIQTKTKVDSYYSNKDLRILIKSNEEKGFETYFDNLSGDDESLAEMVYNDFMWEYEIDEELYTEDFLKEMTETTRNEYGQDKEGLIDKADIVLSISADYNYDITEVLNKKGLEVFEKYEKQRLKEYYYDEISDFINSIEQDEDGLIDIWRVIVFIKKEPDTKDVYNKDNYNKDEYDEIISHGNVGVFWSWDENAAEPHWGSRDGIDLILHAKVKPENINWESTLMKNAWYLKDESEIEVIKGKEVLLHKITTYKRRLRQNKDYSLNIEPMIVKA